MGLVAWGPVGDRLVGVMQETTNQRRLKIPSKQTTMIRAARGARTQLCNGVNIRSFATGQTDPTVDEGKGRLQPGGMRKADTASCQRESPHTTWVVVIEWYLMKTIMYVCSNLVTR